MGCIMLPTLCVQFPMLNKLIATVKSVFVKAPNRVALFKELAPNVPLPPEPVVTRWGTWLAVASYYAENWDAVKTVVMNLRDSDAESIRAAKTLLSDEEIKRNAA